VAGDAGQFGASGHRGGVRNLLLEPAFVPNYWVIYCGVALCSAIGMWYVPYLRGASEQQKSEYRSMYAGTRHLLPERGDNPRPNIFHMGIHTLFVVNFCLAVILRFHQL
jgi:hypothetical protein